LGDGEEEESTSVYAHLCYANQSAAIVVVLVVVFALSTLPVWLSKHQMPLKMDIDTLRYVVMLGVIAIRLRFDYQQQDSSNNNDNRINSNNPKRICSILPISDSFISPINVHFCFQITVCSLN